MKGFAVKLYTRFSVIFETWGLLCKQQENCYYRSFLIKTYYFDYLWILSTYICVCYYMNMAKDMDNLSMHLALEESVYFMARLLYL